MNTKKLIVSALLGLIINVASAGNSASIGYTSDFFYRGAQKAEQSIQSSVDFEKALMGLKGSLHACTNQSVDNGVDSYRIAGGLTHTFLDGLFNGYVGLNHFEDVDGEALSEVAVSASFGSILNPTVSVYRDLDDSLFTFEASVSHVIDMDIVDLGLNASIGNTELTSSNDVTYYAVGASLSRPIGAAEGGLSIDYIDADDVDREFVLSTGLTFKF